MGFFATVVHLIQPPTAHLSHTLTPSLSLSSSLAISEVLYYLETRADICLCLAARQVWFTVCVVRDELCAALVSRRENRRRRGDYLHVLCAFLDACGDNMEGVVHYFSRSMTGGPSVCVCVTHLEGLLFFFSYYLCFVCLWRSVIFGILVLLLILLLAKVNAFFLFTEIY